MDFIITKEEWEKIREETIQKFTGKTSDERQIQRDNMEQFFANIHKEMKNK